MPLADGSSMHLEDVADFLVIEPLDVTHRQDFCGPIRAIVPERP